MATEKVILVFVYIFRLYTMSSYLPNLAPMNSRLGGIIWGTSYISLACCLSQEFNP